MPELTEIITDKEALQTFYDIVEINEAAFAELYTKAYMPELRMLVGIDNA